MCTVSFIPTAKGKIITSNRDEHNGRATALSPVSEVLGDVKICYPKDRKGGGTWIAIKNDGTVAVLLNGAFEAHQKLEFYRQSRGQILLSIIKAASSLNHFKQIDLTAIENFTLVLYQDNKLVECRWDGVKKFIIKKEPNKPHIWSSATLYQQSVRQQREQWFAKWLQGARHIDQQKAINFHLFAGDGDITNSLLMQRENGISTVSITSIYCEANQLQMVYQNIKTGATDGVSLPIVKVDKLKLMVEKLKMRLRITGIKVFNWEYWPMHVVYAPMYLYWFYLSAKARSFFFFSSANPMRTNAGFAMEKKSDSYQYLPKKYFPTTLICKQGISPTSLKLGLDDLQLNFPVIAKPEMGERGTGVKLIGTLNDLVVYSKNCQTDFLVQQFVAYKHEVGVFYCRLPTATKGQITGIVGKQLLAVVGDGNATIKELLKKNGRHLLQLQTLEQEQENLLQEILADGVERIIVPYGNHCRGAKFTDLSHLASEKLNDVIDQLCQQLPSFYFGRLDIKFNTWEELENGINFSVIELNGAASEPTHMYDPKHSIFFAWKEIKRHWDLLYQISMANAKLNHLQLMNTKQGLQMLKDHHKHVNLLANLK